MPQHDYSYVDAYIAVSTFARLAEDGVRMIVSFNSRLGCFEISAYGWPFEKSDSLDTAPWDKAAQDVPRDFNGKVPKREAPCWASSPSLTEAIETVLDAYRGARHAEPPEGEE